jgi:predicted  nucleic acid-binding Zn-ribbon protein
MQKENDDNINKRMKEYVDYVEEKLDRSNKRFDTLYEQYVKLQGEAIQREADLQSERQKTINAVHELGIVKGEYEALKAEFIAEKQRLEKHNEELTNKCNVLSTEHAKLLARVALLEKGQCQIVE